jgi:hypothetical protein
MSSDEKSDAWYLHSQGRRYGPLSEDELRGYFRAGMVKAGDVVAMPGRAGKTAAAEVAALLGESAPVPAPSFTPQMRPATKMPDSIGFGANALPDVRLSPLLMMSTPVEASRNVRWGLALAGILVMALALYAGLSLLRRVQSIHDRPASVSVESVDATHALTNAPDNARRSRPKPRVAAIASHPVPAAPSIGGSTTQDEWFSTADRLYKDSDWLGLHTHSRKWISAEPLRDLPWLFFGIANAGLGQDTQAIDALNRVLPTQPNYPQSRAALAQVYFHARQFQNAANVFHELIRTDPDNARLWNDLGRSYFAIERYADSINALETAVKLDPAFQDAWNNLGAVYQRSGNPESAAQAFAKANALSASTPSME